MSGVIDMVLHCPACGLQHIDAPEVSQHHEMCTAPEFAPWDNPPHRSHLCAGCGHVWRPADVATNGVQAVKTAGKDDSARISPARLSAQHWQHFHDMNATIRRQRAANRDLQRRIDAFYSTDESAK